MKMRCILAFLAAISFGGVSVAHNNLPIPNNTPIKSVNGIAAIVNNDIITNQQLNHAIVAARQQLQHNNIPLPHAAKLRQEVLQQLIYQQLQLQIATRNNIKISDKEVDQVITRIAAQNHATIAQLKQKLVQQHLSYKVFRSQLRKQLTISKLQREAIASTIHINQAEIAAFRKKHATQTNPAQYHVNNILIPLPDSPTPEQVKQAQAKAHKVLQQLRSGKSFSSLVNTHPGSGDLGWRALSELPTLFATTVIKMKIGGVSQPLQAANGFHILKLAAQRQKDVVSNQKIQAIITQQKSEKALQKWLQQLWHSAYIHINKQ